MQVPVAIPVTVFPLTVQTEGVVELNVTVNPEVDAAETVAVLPIDSVVGLNVIVLMLWLIPVSVILFVI